MSPYSVTVAGCEVAERLTLAAARLAAEAHAARFPHARPTVFVYDAEDPWPIDVLRRGVWSSTLPDPMRATVGWDAG